jgi:long-chain fatty acid transport protein
MKKISTLLLLSLFIIQSSLAGGIVTNSNQSIIFLRMLARNASTDIDAVYYNPAGLTKMKDGFYVSISNQTIFQTQTVTNDFMFLNKSEYIGDVKAPVYPSGFAVLKKGKLAISLGFGVLGGGGSATYETGLPSFEYQIAALPALVSKGMGIPTTGYSADIFFDGRSVYWGTQLGISYAINRMISVSVGGRYTMATNTYSGHIKDIMINPISDSLGLTGTMIPAAAFFTAAGQANMTPYVTDKEVDAKQSGTAFTPIIGFNYSPTKRFNLGIKYEMATKLELTNETTTDDTGMFPDGAVSSNDIPAFLAAGVSYYVTKKFKTSVSYRTFFDKDADWGGRETLLDNNSSDISVGFEYLLNEKFIASLGYSLSQTGVTEAYQRDMSYSLSSNVIGLGFKFMATNKLSIDVGGMYVMYDSGASHTLSYEVLGTPFGTGLETLEKSTIDIGIGITYRIH